MREFYKKILLGMGFDCKDSHIRITKGENFRLYGGSDQTHKLMQETAIKFNEQLDRKGKTINDISKEEFHEIASKIGLKTLEDK